MQGKRKKRNENLDRKIEYQLKIIDKFDGKE